MQSQVGIASAALSLAPETRTVAALFSEESAVTDAGTSERLGIRQVPVCRSETGSTLALTAATEALRRAELDAAQVDVIVDYSILPQEFLVPAWNMSNKLQNDLGAKKAFTVGFSGGGATNFLVALSSAAALIETNDHLNTALLVAADVTIPGNRILNPQDPVSVLGDAAGALVLRRGATGNLLIDTELWSDGGNHDIYYIPGGALAERDDPERYKIMLDKQRYDSTPKMDVLHGLLNKLLHRAGVKRDDVAFALYPNISREDQEQFLNASGFRPEQICEDRVALGHFQGTDFIVNYLSMLESASLQKGQYFVAASHGMGFLYGVSLLQY